MKKLINILTPSFLKRLDRELLENHPFLWSKRFAHLLFYGLVILAVNITACCLTPISVFTYTPLWVFIFLFSLISILFLLIWLFFQYKYELAWDYAGLGWGYYFKTSMSYIMVCVLCVLMVVLPAWVYQNRINDFYDMSISIEGAESHFARRNISGTYLNHLGYEFRYASALDGDSEEYLKARDNYIEHLFSSLQYYSGGHRFDTIIKPGVRSSWLSNSLMTLEQKGDTSGKYRKDHVWLVEIDNKKDTKGYQEGTLYMFSPHKFFLQNQEMVYNTFDSNDFSFDHFFLSEYLQNGDFPEPVKQKRFDWEDVLLNPDHLVESQRVVFYDKQVVGSYADTRLGNTYKEYVFVTDLKDQARKIEERYFGAEIRGRQWMLPAQEFFQLKRFEYLLYKRFGVASVDVLTKDFVATHIMDFYVFATLFDQVESDYGYFFTTLDIEKAFVYLLVIYIFSSVLALLMLTVRLLNFRILAMCLIFLAILYFIIFVPFVGFRVHSYYSVALVFLSLLSGLFIMAIVRMLFAKATTKFIKVTALAGLIVLPFIGFYYLNVGIGMMDFESYRVKDELRQVMSFLLILVLLTGHIPLIARVVHRAFYLPAK